MRKSHSKGTIVFAGSLAQKPYRGGHTWVFLQYLLGFRRLGWDVLFLDRLEPEMCVDDARAPCRWNVGEPPLFSRRHGAVRLTMPSRWRATGQRFIGLSREEIETRVRDAATFINVMGFFTDPEILAQARQRVFLDIDPGFGQMWQALGCTIPIAVTIAYVTVGENIGQPDCTVPTCGLTWITTRQPVVLEQWPPGGRLRPMAGSPASAAWRGPYGPIEYGGTTYGLRAHEFRKFATLPSSGRETLRGGARHRRGRDQGPRAAGGERLAPGRSESGGARSVDVPRLHRGSKAEFMVAKNMYVQSNSGWFSDRSICYLASGRPVLAQDTGLSALYPVGQGAAGFRHPGGGGGRRRGDRRRLRGALPGRPRGRRGVFRLRPCPVPDCDDAWHRVIVDAGPATHRPGQRRHGQQASERRRSLGASELGARAPRLGCHVYFVEQIRSDTCVDAAGHRRPSNNPPTGDTSTASCAGSEWSRRPA